MQTIGAAISKGKLIFRLCFKPYWWEHAYNSLFPVMIALKDIRSLTDFQRNTKAHLKRLKATGRPEVLTVNGKAELIVQNASAYEETLDAIRGIQRGLDEMKAGTGKPARKALDKIRSKYKSPRATRVKTHQAWVNEAMSGEFGPGSAARLRQIAAKARAAVV